MTIGRNGFTLLEVLVAMALLVILSSALYGTYFTLANGRERAAEGMESRRELRGTLDLLRREITAASFVTGNKRLRFVVEDRDEFGKPASTLALTSFTAPLTGSFPHSDQADIVYRPEVREEKMVLMRRARDLQISVPPVPYPQVEQLDGFLVECFDGGKWIRSWDTALNGKLPKSVRVTISIREGEAVSTLSIIASPAAGES
jgi:general secretion pathway protein J